MTIAMNVMMEALRGLVARAPEARPGACRQRAIVALEGGMDGVPVLCDRDPGHVTDHGVADLLTWARDPSDTCAPMASPAPAETIGAVWARRLPRLPEHEARELLRRVVAAINPPDLHEEHEQNAIDALQDARAHLDAYLGEDVAATEEPREKLHARLVEACAAALDRAGYHSRCKASPARVREAGEEELDGVLVEVRDQIRRDLEETMGAEEKAKLDAALRAVVELWASL